MQATDGVANTQGPPSGLNAKLQQIEAATVRTPYHGSHHLSLFSQAPVDNLDTSMRAGTRGPTEISDPIARERISHFDHERIPERVVHARGAGAHGVFKLHTSLADVTCAKVLTEVGKETPTFVRFSTVLGSSGAAETAREVRGFATRWYTEQGNWDLVGNNIPVFFIQDGVKFVDLVHAGKPVPSIHLPQAQTAHDNFWDWMSLTDESLHMAAWILSDHTIPRSYRHMRGAGVNTFVLVNEQGKRTFVKYHWKPHQGQHGLVWDEALKLGGQDPDFFRRDLADAISSGGYPQWELGVQLVDESDEDSFDFDLLDCTKLVPEELVPIKWVGTMTLNRNPTNYFAETEQVAFCTSNIVPGMDYSNDPMLQLRNFSYFDTQISRLGGVNFNQLPINRGVCPFISTARDGQHAHQIRAGPNYHPNRFSVPTDASKEYGKGQNYATDEQTVQEFTKINPNGVTYSTYDVKGKRAKQRPPKFAETVAQAQLFYNSQSDVEKQHMIEALQFELGHCDDRGVQERMINRFNEMDHNFAKQVGEAFDIMPGEPKHPNNGRKSTGQLPMSMQDSQNVFTAVGRKVGIFVLDGYDPLQVSALSTALSAIGVVVHFVGLRKGPAYPSGVKKGDKDATGVQYTHFSIEGCRSTYFDALFFPSGNDEYNKSLEQGRVIHFVREAFGHFKPIAAVGSAVPWIAHKCLPGSTDIKADLTDTYSSKNGLVLGQNVVDADASIWTKLTQGTKDAATFGQAFLEACAAHRHWARDVSGVAF
ncbi:catalase 1 [Microbotryomycetes sp. JL221]|nr:catalase 1 [Microbotryomycetes sp. JL221]